MSVGVSYKRISTSFYLFVSKVFFDILRKISKRIQFYEVYQSKNWK